MKISLIIPCYNGEKYLDATINSVLNQTKKPDEIIIVDDCSKDKSLELIKNYSKKHKTIKLIQNPVNKGLSATRNIGIQNSKGDIIIFIDVDCVADQNLVKNLFNFYREDKENKIGAIGGHGIESNIQTVYDKYRKEYMTQAFSSKENLTEVNWFFGLCCSFRKKALTEAGLFNPIFRTNGEDADIAMRIKKQGYQVFYSNNVFVYHHKQDDLKSLLRTIFNGLFWGRIAKYKNKDLQTDIKEKNYLVNGLSLTFGPIFKDISKLRFKFLLIDIVTVYHKFEALFLFQILKNKLLEK
ncbi:MAG: glycosyltransferase [Candidatus Pacearchaeota archaeon]|jgi:glycosyltransferase involved in cell wall biosynthesis